MKNLSNYQRRVLDKIYPDLSNPAPEKELLRLCMLYRTLIESIDDQHLHEEFCLYVESQLLLALKSMPQFYHLEYFKECYNQLSSDYIEDNTDAIAGDYIEYYISSQQDVINKKVTYPVVLEGYESVDPLQFVSKAFFDAFIPSSRAKIRFLEAKITREQVVELENPYPLLFVSREVYDRFTQYAPKKIISYHADYSYLKKRLEDEKLIHRTTDHEFMRIIYEDMKFVSKKDYTDYLVKGGLSSLRKASNDHRENEFNNLFLD